MKRPTKEDVIDKMLAEVDEAARQLQADLDHDELGGYVAPDGSIYGERVDASEDITPQQVATLGGYVVAVELAKQLRKIAGKKEEKPKKSKTTITHTGVIGVKIDAKTGKSIIVNEGEKIPPQVLQALKDFLKEQDNE